MKAIILAGGENSRLAPLTEMYPKPLIPFLNTPLLVSQLQFLGRNGFTKIGLAVSPNDAEAITRAVGDGASCGVRVRYQIDEFPRGSAGCLKGFQQFIGDDPFLVIGGNVFLGSLDLGELIKFHDANSALATLGMYRDRTMPAPVEHVENVTTSAEGRVQSFHVLHPSRDRRRPRRFGGVSFFDCRVLDFVSGDGYMDIKEQLIPAMNHAGCHIFEHALVGFQTQVTSVDDYFHAHRAALEHGVVEDTEWTRAGDRIWSGQDVRIAPSAFLLGPVLLGRNCVIGDGVHLIGPAVIGNDCVIERGSLIRESVVWDGTRVGERAHIEYCIAGRGLTIGSGTFHQNALLMDAGSQAIDAREQRTGGGRFPSATVPGASRGRLSTAGKRILDVLVAVAGLAFTAPLFLLLALLIKFDSPGPVFFRQRRCGLNGREFRMIKFRTMVANADALQKSLIAKNNVDGPVFKLFDDPRVTRVGRVLRRTSLDELPQLVNVLRGEMSLVGPRPLAANEIRFNPTWGDFRLRVKPGLTGLWQLHGRSRPGFHEWIRCDIEYVKRQSFGLDLKILLKTALVVLKGI